MGNLLDTLIYQYNIVAEERGWQPAVQNPFKDYEIDLDYKVWKLFGKDSYGKFPSRSA